jgi:hypothetical protein
MNEPDPMSVFHDSCAPSQVWLSMSDRLKDVGTVDLNSLLHAEQLADGWYVVGMGMLIRCRDRSEAEAIVEDMKTNGDGDTTH